MWKAENDVALLARYGAAAAATSSSDKVNECHEYAKRYSNVVRVLNQKSAEAVKATMENDMKELFNATSDHRIAGGSTVSLAIGYWLAAMLICQIIGNYSVDLTALYSLVGHLKEYLVTVYCQLGDDNSTTPLSCWLTHPRFTFTKVTSGVRDEDFSPIVSGGDTPFVGALFTGSHLPEALTPMRPHVKLTANQLKNLLRRNRLGPPLPEWMRGLARGDGDQKVYAVDTGGAKHFYQVSMGATGYLVQKAEPDFKIKTNEANGRMSLDILKFLCQTDKCFSQYLETVLMANRYRLTESTDIVPIDSAEEAGTAAGSAEEAGTAADFAEEAGTAADLAFVHMHEHFVPNLQNVQISEDQELMIPCMIVLLGVEPYSENHVGIIIRDVLKQRDAPMDVLKHGGKGMDEDTTDLLKSVVSVLKKAVDWREVISKCITKAKEQLRDQEGDTDYYAHTGASTEMCAPVSEPPSMANLMDKMLVWQPCKRVLDEKSEWQGGDFKFTKPDTWPHVFSFRGCCIVKLGSASKLNWRKVRGLDTNVYYISYPLGSTLESVGHDGDKTYTVNVHQKDFGVERERVEAEAARAEADAKAKADANAATEAKDRRRWPLSKMRTAKRAPQSPEGAPSSPSVEQEDADVAQTKVSAAAEPAKAADRSSWSVLRPRVGKDLKDAPSSPGVRRKLTYTPGVMNNRWAL